jgi:hypothetical protein
LVFFNPINYIRIEKKRKEMSCNREDVAERVVQELERLLVLSPFLLTSPQKTPMIRKDATRFIEFVNVEQGTASTYSFSNGQALPIV